MILPVYNGAVIINPIIIIQIQHANSACLCFVDNFRAKVYNLISWNIRSNLCLVKQLLSNMKQRMKWIRWTMTLEQTSSAVGGPTEALDVLPFNWTCIIVVVPCELLQCLDPPGGEEEGRLYLHSFHSLFRHLPLCKEGHPWEAEVMGVNKHILNKHVGGTAVLWSEETLHTNSHNSWGQCQVNHCC